MDVEKLPQNIQALIGEIGEKQVLLRLYLLVHQTSWQVFYNLGEAGYDVLLFNSTTSEKVRIEVKTRQKLYTTGKNNRTVNYYLTDGEFLACDFLIAYFLDANEFYIVPKADLKRVTAAHQIRWRFTLTRNLLNQPHKRFVEYLFAWQRLHADFENEG